MRIRDHGPESVVSQPESEQRQMTWDEFRVALDQLPKHPELWGRSAEIIREFRGPLPADDPDFLNADRR